MPVTLRPATLADAPAIAHVQVGSWRTTYRGLVPDTFLTELNVPTQTEKWAEWLQIPTVLTFVAKSSTESGAEVVGFISGGPIREPQPGIDAELYATYLLQPWQGQGIGRQLVHSLSSALLQNCRSLLVWVLEANPSVRFYRSLAGIEQHRKTITLADTDLPEISFVWPDLTTLAQT